MSYPTPLAGILALVAARDAGDIETALDCYTAEPTVVAQPGAVVTGREAARAVLEGFVALHAVFTVSARTFLESPTAALHLSAWTLRGAEGSGIDFAGVTTDVFERRQDGGWLLAVDNPYGVSIV